MKIPDSIIKRLEVIEEKVKKRQEEKKLAKEAEKKRLEKIDAYRKTKLKELEPAADKIMNWFREFCFGPSGQGKRILDLDYDINIYVGSFWLGEPSPDSKTVWAVLCIDIKRRLLYREKCKGMTAKEIVTGNKKSLIENLHPDFVLEAAKAIEDDSVWKHVENSITRIYPF